MEHNYSAKNVFWYLLNGVLVIAILFGLIAAASMLRQANAVVPSRTITVTGEGKVSIAPDIATISFSVVSQGVKADEVQKANTEKINLAIEYLKKQGIEPKDIQTSGYNLYPRYRYTEKTGESTISGYELTQTVNVKIRDLVKAGEIVGGLSSAGVNQISSFSYGIEDPEATRDLARKEAFDNAFAKADAMANRAGVRIARVVTFSESTPYGGPIYYDRMYSMGGKAEAMNAPAAPTLEPGEEEIMVNVSVTYEIR